VLRLDPLGSWALGLLGTWGLALSDLERPFDDFGVVSVDRSAFSLLPFCGTSLPSESNVLRLDPLDSWELGLLGSWSIGLLGTWGLALLDLDRLFETSAVVSVVSSSLPLLPFWGP
jgi:hypothetical protein